MKKYLFLIYFLFITFIIIAKEENNILQKEYQATVVPIIKATIQYPYDDEMPGIVIYTAKPGTILKGATYSANGKMIKEGDILIKYKNNRRKNIYKVRKHELRHAEAVLKFAAEDLKRFKTLMNGAQSTTNKHRNIISRSTYEKSVSDFLKAQSDVEKAKVQMTRAENWLKLTTEHAYYDCIVTEVFTPLGLCAFEEDIMVVAQLNPMGIKINIPHEEVYNIPENQPLKIYPFNGEDLIITYGFNKIISDDGVILRIKNDPIPPYIPQEYKNLPTVSKLRSVERFSVSLKNLELAVPKICLSEDNNGKFVWKATINTSLNTKKYKRILLLDIVKVYIKPGEEQRYITPHHLYIKLSDASSLKINDYILDKDQEDNLNNFKQIIFFKKRYTFSPGDSVKVKFG